MKSTDRDRDIRRAIWQTRLRDRRLLATIALMTGLFALFVWLALDAPTERRYVRATVEAIATATLDDGPRLAISARTTEALYSVTARGALLSPAPGDPICLALSAGRILKRERPSLVPDRFCADL